MQVHGPVLAATALDPGSDEAIRQAWAVATDAGAPCVVCHVLPEIYGFRPLFPQMNELDREYAARVRATAESAVHQQIRRLLGDEARIEVQLEDGSPHAGVLRVAEEIGAGMVVVGFGSAEEGASLGGVAERVVRYAHCPVRVAVERRGRAVLAATDFSDPALPAVQAARAEARRLELKLTVVHSVDLPVIPIEAPETSSALMIAHLLEARREEARERLEETARELGEGAELVLRVGSASEAILATAEEIQAELVVVGTHGRTGLSRLALGSVAEAVVRRSRRSVMVVRLGG